MDAFGWIIFAIVICGGFDSMVKQLGPSSTSIIIIVGLVGLSIATIAEQICKRRRCCCNCSNCSPSQDDDTDEDDTDEDDTDEDDTDEDD